MQTAKISLPACITILLALSTAGSPPEASEWINLVGLTAVLDKIPIQIDLQGAEDFDLKVDRLRNLVVERLKKEGLLPGSGTQLPTLSVSIVGRSGGNGGADYSIELTLTARVQSPFTKERTIVATIWQASQSDHQLMSYDPTKQKLMKPPGPLNRRVEITLGQLLERFVADVRKANAK